MYRAMTEILLPTKLISPNFLFCFRYHCSENLNKISYLFKIWLKGCSYNIFDFFSKNIRCSRKFLNNSNSLEENQPWAHKNFSTWKIFARINFFVDSVHIILTSAYLSRFTKSLLRSYAYSKILGQKNVHVFFVAPIPLSVKFCISVSCTNRRLYFWVNLLLKN